MQIFRDMTCFSQELLNPTFFPHYVAEEVEDLVDVMLRYDTIRYDKGFNVNLKAECVQFSSPYCVAIPCHGSGSASSDDPSADRVGGANNIFCMGPLDLGQRSGTSRTTALRTGRSTPYQCVVMYCVNYLLIRLYLYSL